MIAHMFWAYGEFSRMELMCATSFLENGYDLNIWTYGKMSRVPRGAKLRNARELISEDLVFLNKRGSYASFSDMFRYKVLHDVGGLYSDTDVVALKSVDELPEKQFLVTERTSSGGLKINNNIIYNPSPAKGNIVDLARAYSEIFPKHQISWGEIGPTLLTAMVQINPSHNFEIYPPEFANNIDYWLCPSMLIDDSNHKLTRHSFFLHLYNEMWRLAGINKNGNFSSTSLYAKLLDRFGC